MTPNILKAIADNQALFDEVKRVLLQEFDEIPYGDGASDELLGQVTRARITGRRMVEEAFRKIAAHRTPPVHPEKQNGAR